jgi:hypothetical protein
MKYLKARMFAVLLIIISSGLIYWNWYQLHAKGEYSMKLAAFAPLVAVGGVFLLFFPSRAGKPDTTSDKVITFMVFVIGLLAGLANWFLMDPGFFGM